MPTKDSAILGATSFAAPAVIGTTLWPAYSLAFMSLSFVVLGTLYLAYKRRARRQ